MAVQERLTVKVPAGDSLTSLDTRRYFGLVMADSSEADMGWHDIQKNDGLKSYKEVLASGLGYKVYDNVFNASVNGLASPEKGFYYQPQKSTASTYTESWTGNGASKTRQGDAQVYISEYAWLKVDHHQLNNPSNIPGYPALTDGLVVTVGSSPAGDFASFNTGDIAVYSLTDNQWAASPSIANKTIVYETTNNPLKWTGSTWTAFTSHANVDHPGDHVYELVLSTSTASEQLGTATYSLKVDGTSSGLGITTPSEGVSIQLSDKGLYLTFVDGSNSFYDGDTYTLTTRGARSELADFILALEDDVLLEESNKYGKMLLHKEGGFSLDFFETNIKPFAEKLMNRGFPAFIIFNLKDRGSDTFEVYYNGLRDSLERIVKENGGHWSVTTSAVVDSEDENLSLTMDIFTKLLRGEIHQSLGDEDLGNTEAVETAKDYKEWDNVSTDLVNSNYNPFLAFAKKDPWNNNKLGIWNAPLLLPVPAKTSQNQLRYAQDAVTLIECVTFAGKHLRSMVIEKKIPSDISRLEERYIAVANATLNEEHINGRINGLELLPVDQNGDNPNDFGVDSAAVIENIEGEIISNGVSYARLVVTGNSYIQVVNLVTSYLK